MKGEVPFRRHFPLQGIPRNSAGASNIRRSEANEIFIRDAALRQKRFNKRQLAVCPAGVGIRTIGKPTAAFLCNRVNPDVFAAENLLVRQIGQAAAVQLDGNPLFPGGGERLPQIGIRNAGLDVVVDGIVGSRHKRVRDGGDAMRQRVIDQPHEAVHQEFCVFLGGVTQFGWHDDFHVRMGMRDEDVIKERHVLLGQAEFPFIRKFGFAAKQQPNAALLRQRRERFFQRQHVLHVLRAVPVACAGHVLIPEVIGKAQQGQPVLFCAPQIVFHGRILLCAGRQCGVNMNVLLNMQHRILSNA